MHLGMGQRIVRCQRRDVRQLGRLSLQKLASRRDVEEQVAHADGCSQRQPGFFHGENLASSNLNYHAGGVFGGVVVEIAGGKILTVEEAGLPLGTSISVRDLFFNIPARRKFLKAEPTELSHIASLVTHYALAHPKMHWELHSATNAMLIAARCRSLATHLSSVWQGDARPAHPAQRAVVA